MTEILAPVGSIKAFYAAINAGCDAIYLAGEAYGARKAIDPTGANISVILFSLLF